MHSHEAYQRPDSRGARASLDQPLVAHYCHAVFGLQSMSTMTFSAFGRCIISLVPTRLSMTLTRLEKMLSKVAVSRQRRETTYIFSCFVLSQLGRPQACPSILELGMEGVARQLAYSADIGFYLHRRPQRPRARRAIYLQCLFGARAFA